MISLLSQPVLSQNMTRVRVFRRRQKSEHSYPFEQEISKESSTSLPLSYWVIDCQTEIPMYLSVVNFFGPVLNDLLCG